MDIPLTCPNPSCRKPLQARDGLAGKHARCAGCGTVLMVPGSALVAEGSAELPSPGEIPPDGDDLPVLDCVGPVAGWTPVGDPDEAPTARPGMRKGGMVSGEFCGPARTLGGYAIVIGLIYTIESLYRLAWEEAGVFDFAKLLTGTLWIGSGYWAWKGSVEAIRLVLGMSYLYLIGSGWLVLSGSDIHLRDFIGWLVLLISLVMIYTAHDTLGKAKR
jgi:LSD1 subclass zinc finger protein